MFLSCFVATSEIHSPGCSFKVKIDMIFQLENCTSDLNFGILFKEQIWKKIKTPLASENFVKKLK
jgi:hypothetical protein